MDTGMHAALVQNKCDVCAWMHVRQMHVNTLTRLMREVLLRHADLVFTHARTHANTHTYAQTRRQTRTHTCKHTHTHMHKHADPHTRTHTCKHTHTRTHANTHTHTRTHANTGTESRMHTHTHTLKHFYTFKQLNSITIISDTDYLSTRRKINDVGSRHEML